MRLGLRLVFVLISVVFAVATSPTVRGQAGRPAPNAAVMPFDVTEKSIEDLQRAMQTGEVTSRQLVDIYLTRIAAYDQQGPALNAIATLNPRAREAAMRSMRSGPAEVREAPSTAFRSSSRTITRRSRCRRRPDRWRLRHSIRSATLFRFSV